MTLRPRDPQGLAAYASAVATAGSSVYHEYLTVPQFATRFGPTPAQVSAVESSLRAHGLTPGAVSANNLSISISATAGQLERAFSLGFNRVKLPDGQKAYANTAPPKFDSAVAGFVQGVVGLSTLALPKPLGLTAAHVLRHATPKVVTGGPQPCSAASSVGEYTADQIASAYRYSSLYQAGDEGAGQTIALYELEPNVASDIPAYQSCYGTSASVSYLSVDGGPGAFQSGDGLETELDIEDVVGLAPKASFLVYQGPNTGTGAYGTYSAIISQDKAKVISTSWGLCERYEGSGAASSENTLFQEAATQGQSIFAASGDSGSEDCGTSALAVDDPASQPYVTGVGGTSMSALGPPPTQKVWHDQCSSGPCGGGGGVSTLWGMPSYQSGAAAALKVINSYSSGSQCRAVKGSYCREVPDVSADADPATGYAIYYDGSWIGIGGTSGAAPTWAAFAALVNASSSCHGTPIGFANPALYKAAGTNYSADFSDITTGNNDITGTGGGKYPAATGYDMASGLGTPIGSTLSAALCGGSGTATVSVTNPGTQTGTVGSAASLQIQASDSDSGTLTYSATGLPAGLQINASTGLITGTPTTAQSTSVTVKATDASGPSSTATFTWTINPATAGVTITNPGPQTSVHNVPLSLQIQATDTDGGALTYTATGLPQGLSINHSTGLISGTPTFPQTVNTTVTATDATGPFASASFTWTINRGKGPNVASLSQIW